MLWLSFLVIPLFLQDVADNGLKANTWVGEVAPIISGKGGGKDVSAQATGNNTKGLSKAMKMALDFAHLKLS